MSVKYALLIIVHISGFMVVHFALGYLAALGLIMIVFPLWVAIGFLIGINSVSVSVLAKMHGYDERT